jgi:hypothetical protein
MRLLRLGERRWTASFRPIPVTDKKLYGNIQNAARHS